MANGDVETSLDDMSEAVHGERMAFTAYLRRRAYGSVAMESMVQSAIRQKCRLNCQMSSDGYACCDDRVILIHSVATIAKPR